MELSCITAQTNNAEYFPTQIHWGTRVSLGSAHDSVHNSEMMNEAGGGATKRSPITTYNKGRNKSWRSPHLVSVVSSNGELITWFDLDHM